jgi:hypothetical protein
MIKAAKRTPVKNKVGFNKARPKRHSDAPIMVKRANIAQLLSWKNCHIALNYPYLHPTLDLNDTSKLVFSAALILMG